MKFLLENYRELDVDNLENQRTGLDTSFDVEELVDGLEENRESVIQILEQQIDDVQSEINSVREVYEDNASKLEETIRKQSTELDRAENSAGKDEREIRDRLARLYRELRQERRKELQNRLELKMRKWELQRELEELDDLDDLGSRL